MTTDSLTSIDHLEQELTELQSELQGGLRLLAALNQIPGNSRRWESSLLP
jgi:hypothetical protein